MKRLLHFFLTSLSVAVFSAVTPVSGATNVTTTYVPGPFGPVQKVVATTTTSQTCVPVTCPVSGTVTSVKRTVTRGGTVCQSCSTTSSTAYERIWLHPDYQGSINVETSQAATPLPGSLATYKPYGDWLTQPTANESLGYTGQRRDASTGLLFLHARYYDPVLSRFISADPVAPKTEIVTLNHYAYADNDPINRTDVTGLQAAADATGTGSQVAIFANMQKEEEERRKRGLAKLNNPGSIGAVPNPHEAPFDRQMKASLGAGLEALALPATLAEVGLQEAGVEEKTARMLVAVATIGVPGKKVPAAGAPAAADDWTLLLRQIAETTELFSKNERLPTCTFAAYRNAEYLDALGVRHAVSPSEVPGTSRAHAFTFGEHPVTKETFMMTDGRVYYGREAIQKEIGPFKMTGYYTFPQLKEALGPTLPELMKRKLGR